MKLRNLIFALFLAIGAIGFTACTGDDGATGPAGPAGPQGPPGEPAEPGGSGDTTTAFYDFLKSWGSSDGEVGCDSPLLDEMAPAPLPGPALTPLTTTEAAQTALNGPVAATCAAGLFAASPGVMLPGGTSIDVAVNTFAFVKTGRAKADSETTSVASTEFNPPHTLTTDKEFVGGMVYAEMDTTGGSDEPFERGLLYSSCGVGTPPTDVRGEWRAVRITDTRQNYVDGKPSTEAADKSVTTTTKVCMRLDSVPGATKCYVRVVAPDGPDADENPDVTEQIALYDGALDTIIPNDKLPDIASPTGATFVIGNDGGSDTTNDVPVVQRLCEFFDEG